MGIFGDRNKDKGRDEKSQHVGGSPGESASGPGGGRSTHTGGAIARATAASEKARAGSGAASDASKGSTGSLFGRSDRTERAGEKPKATTNARTGGETVATIGKSIIFKGELTGDEDLEIEGLIEGDIQLPNHVLTIGAHGKVTAEIVAKGVQIIGHVSGNVRATERIEIQASGVVEGDISAPRLLIQEGAVVNGKIDMAAAGSASKGKTESAPAPTGGQPGSGEARKAG